jgi:hypothetical protein
MADLFVGLPGNPLALLAGASKAAYVWSAGAPCSIAQQLQR